MKWVVTAGDGSTQTVQTLAEAWALTTSLPTPVSAAVQK